MVDYLTFGGIYRDVHLRYVEPVHIADVFVRTLDVLTDTPKVEVDVILKNQDSVQHSCKLQLAVRAGLDGIAGAEQDVIVPGGSQTNVTLALSQLPEIALWTLDQPRLYGLDAFLRDAEGKPIDAVSTRFGFREAVFKDDGFTLNGEHVKLIGLDRHQTYPYIGGAAPERLQRKDADILKYELGCNIVRTSHYPQSPHFLDRCDEIGLLVFEEIPGWQFIGDNDWQALSLRDVESMVTRDRNHPSIVLWGVRINESWDDEAFYTATNALAHQLDPTRQTGGVRFFQESQFLEDVFTFNDFSNTIVEPLHTPHLVTEFSGHMFPTKTFDNEERQIEHALRHTRIQNQQLGMPNVTGAIGWCAFDYNTHVNFGSGDRICYHGVMDTFRLPKFAAYFYATQLIDEPVVHIASFFTPGDRSVGGIDPFYVYSNCDEVELFFGDESYGRFQPDREHFPNLPHPPFLISGFAHAFTFSEARRDLRVVGYKNGQAAAEQLIDADGVPKQLILRVDDTELKADGADMTRLSFLITDKYGNRLPYANLVVSFEIEGEGKLIGENPFALVGGQAALYVKATHQPGTITVRARAPRLPAAEVQITTV